MERGVRLTAFTSRSFADLEEISIINNKIVFSAVFVIIFKLENVCYQALKCFMVIKMKVPTYAT